MFYGGQKLIFVRNVMSDGSGTWDRLVVDTSSPNSGIWPSLLTDVRGRPAVAFTSSSSLIYLRAATASGTVSAWSSAPPNVTTISSTFAPTQQTTQVAGDLILTNTSTIVLVNSQQIVVTGEAVLSGSVNLSVNQSGAYQVETILFYIFLGVANVEGILRS